MSGGAAGTWYKLDSAASFTAGTAVTISGAGSHTLQYYSRDAAGNIEATKTVTVVGTSGVPAYTLTPSAGLHGAISPATPQTVNAGDSLEFTITPDAGYRVADVLVDGTSVGAVTSYRFPNVAASHTIAASFAAMTKPVLGTPTNPKSVKKSRSFTVSGSVKPGSPGGPSVKLKAYRLKAGKWVAYKYYSAKVTGTKYSAKVKITRTGKFRFMAYYGRECHLSRVVKLHRQDLERPEVRTTAACRTVDPCGGPAVRQAARARRRFRVACAASGARARSRYRHLAQGATGGSFGAVLSVVREHTGLGATQARQL